MCFTRRLPAFLNLFRVFFERFYQSISFNTFMTNRQIDDFVNHLKLSGFSTRTIDSYMFHVNHFLRWCNKEIELVDREDIRNYFIKLVNAGYSANTIILV